MLDACLVIHFAWFNFISWRWMRLHDVILQETLHRHSCDNLKSYNKKINRNRAKRKRPIISLQKFTPFHRFWLVCFWSTNRACVINMRRREKYISVYEVESEGGTCSSEGRHRKNYAAGDVNGNMHHCQKLVSSLSVHFHFQCVSQCYRPLSVFLFLHISVAYVTLYLG